MGAVICTPPAFTYQTGLGARQMGTMKEALLGKSIGDYLTLSGSGGGSPMHSVGDDGVRQGSWSASGDVEARIPIDMLIKDAMIRLQAGGYGYGGRVELPQKFQDFGAPAEINYGDLAATNIGLGFTRGDTSADLNYNPSSNDYKLGYSSGGFSGNMDYNPETNDKSIYAKYKMKF